MTLPTVPFGRTDMEITRVGFGAWAAGGADWWYSWGPQDDDVSVAAMRRAVELGVNWVDTAAIYGLGHSEEVVGRLLAELPEADRPLVFTKCGLVWDDTDRNGVPAFTGRPESVRAECDASLKRLGVDRLDLFQMHQVPQDVPVEEYWGTLLELKVEGKIRAAGLSNHPVELLERAEALGHVDSDQPPFSALRRVAAADVVPWCAAHGTAVITYSPMQAGLLTGAFTLERAAALGPGDWRSRDDMFIGDNLVRNLALSEALQPVADKHGVGRGAVAVAWVAAWPGITAAIAGARTPEQVDGWAAAASLELDAEDLAAISAAIERTGAGEGPARP